MMFLATMQEPLRTVFLIVMENHNWSDIKNKSSAPSINQTFLPMASYAEQYYNPPGIHPKQRLVRHQAQSHGLLRRRDRYE
jgi:hypothetical protein